MRSKMSEETQAQHKFEIGNLVFTITSNLWMHVIDKDGRQENAFGKQSVLVLLEAVKDEYFSVVEPQLEWFDKRDVFYVEYYRTWPKTQQAHVIIHTGGGYRLHMGLGEFKQLLDQLRSLLEAQPLLGFLI